MFSFFPPSHPGYKGTHMNSCSKLRKYSVKKYVGAFIWGGVNLPILRLVTLMNLYKNHPFLYISEYLYLDWALDVFEKLSPEQKY